MIKISIIVATSKKNVIGNKNKLLWHISEDLKRFKNLTSGHHILMGQNTYESIGKVLPNRTNLVLSFEKDYKVPDGFVFNDPKDAIDFAEKNGEQELFIIGGGMVYKEFLPKANKIYLTRVLKDYDGDTCFPEIKLNEWEKTFYEKHSDCDPKFEFIILERK